MQQHTSTFQTLNLIFNAFTNNLPHHIPLKGYLSYLSVLLKVIKLCSDKPRVKFSRKTSTRDAYTSSTLLSCQVQANPRASVSSTKYKYQRADCKIFTMIR